MSSDLRARVGSKVERYRHLRELGRGAMGVVDLVYDEVREAPVARKRMHQLTSDARFQIKQEFRQAQEIRHPNLVRLYDLFADEADAFFTMEPVFGTDVVSQVRGTIERGATGAAETVALIVDRMRQLVDAVAALHDAGIVHRDIKPSNVLVQRDSNRVVLLDFGFSSVLESDFTDSEDRALVGTIPYMAPEALWGAAPSTRSDWYSVGVIAAELCLGRPLFAGSLQSVLRDKDRPPETLRATLPELPESIDALVCGLLHRDPARRPHDPAAICAVLGSVSPPLPMRRSSGIASTFVGRSAELAELERAIPSEPRAQLVRLHGPSGIGKTALARELTARLSRRPGWVVFRGRCHPREHLALKALDSVMDEVSRYLKRAGARVCERIARIDGMDALTRMFPVLGRVPELALLDATPDGTDPQTRWLDGLRAFRALWVELTNIDRIAVFIDDLQWADKDGLTLLHEMLAVEPRPKVTWLVSHRSSGPTKDDPAAVLSLDAPEGSFDLSLSGLRSEEAAELSIRLGASRANAGDVAKEAAGSPFLVSELARFAASSGRVASVDSILDARMGALDPEERALAEQLALADEPLPVQALQSHSGQESVLATLARLESAALARSSFAGDLGEVAELYHDRIREAVAARMQEPVRRAVHLQLAVTLEQIPGVTPASIAFHYRRAGARERGLALTLQAAEECTRSLAFDQAAELYEEAIALCDEPKPCGLIERAADALACAGRCEAAAHRFLDAAARSGDPQRKRTLRLQAGAHYLDAARTTEGREVLGAALREYGLSWPKRPVLSSLWKRVRVLMSSTDIRAMTPASPEAAGRFDTLWAVAQGTGMVDHAVGDFFALLALREAIALRDPSRLLWALGHETVSEANIGGRYLHRRARERLSQVRVLAEQTGKPYDRAYASLVEGGVAFFEADFVRAEDALRAAARLYRQGSGGAFHDRQVASTFLLSTLIHQGKIAELRAVLSDVRAIADRTGNIPAKCLFLLGSAEIGRLAEDRPDDAIREADAALEAWPLVPMQHEGHFMATLAARLYAGRGAEAWQQVVRTWPLLERSNFLKLDLFGMLLRFLRARAALQAGALAAGSERRKLIAAARSDADAIGRSSLIIAAPLRAAIDYGICAIAGNKARATRHCEDALAGFDRAGMQLAREAARLRAGSLCSDRQRGEIERERAHAWFAAAGVRNPEAMARLMMPGDPATSFTEFRETS